MERPIDAGILQDNLTDIYGDGNRLVYLKDVLDLIDEQPTLTPSNEPLTLEQLREMEGQPVWVEFEDGSGGIWGIVLLAILTMERFIKPTPTRPPTSTGRRGRRSGKNPESATTNRTEFVTLQNGKNTNVQNADIKPDGSIAKITAHHVAEP